MYIKQFNPWTEDSVSVRVETVDRGAQISLKLKVCQRVPGLRGQHNALLETSNSSLSYETLITLQYPSVLMREKLSCGLSTANRHDQAFTLQVGVLSSIPIAHSQMQDGGCSFGCRHFLLLG